MGNRRTRHECLKGTIIRVHIYIQQFQSWTLVPAEIDTGAVLPFQKARVSVVDSRDEVLSSALWPVPIAPSPSSFAKLVPADSNISRVRARCHFDHRHRGPPILTWIINPNVIPCVFQDGLAVQAGPTPTVASLIRRVNEEVSIQRSPRPIDPCSGLPCVGRGLRGARHCHDSRCQESNHANLSLHNALQCSPLLGQITLRALRPTGNESAMFTRTVSETRRRHSPSST